MVAKVEKQNVGDGHCTPMVGNFKGAAYRAKTKLVLNGPVQLSWHSTAPLYEWRLKLKATAQAAARETAKVTTYSIATRHHSIMAETLSRHKARYRLASFADQKYSPGSTYELLVQT